jgi:tRNA threonylcarbamoyladenosine biosynthesis protein TsaB
VITLAINASTYAGNVVVIRDGEVLSERGVAMKGSEADALMPAVADALRTAGAGPREIGRIICGAGPGSFTSLRIAGAIAKGLATGVGCPLFAVPSMGLMVGGADLPPGRYLAAVDALRQEFYVGLYAVAVDGSVEELERARIVGSERVGAISLEYDAAVLSTVPMEGARVAPPKARAVLQLAALIADRGPVDVASWEPAYGRLAEAQVKWESANGRPLPVG